MTQEEIKEIERVFGKPIDEVDWFDIPTYIRERDEKWRCPECGEIRIGDARVEAGMKCYHCAY